MTPETSSPTDPAAAGAHTLMAQIYSQLHQLAEFKMARQQPGQTVQATALVHEVWLKLAKDADRRWENPRQFFATAAEAMRQILIDRARRRQALRRGGKLERADFHEPDIAAPARDEIIVQLDEAMAELAKADPLKAEIVNMRFFVGMTTVEIAKLLGVTERTVERHWAFAKAWLFKQVSDR
jgi:RNA polymerase sigma factor (TIGR02999 family)